MPRTHPVRVAIDGPDAAGKTTTRTPGTSRAAYPGTIVRGFFLGIALSVLVASSAAGASVKLGPYVPVLRGGTSTALLYRPHRLVVAGDGTAIVTHVRYRSYGGAPARAEGILLVDDCRPNCAAGTFHPVDAHLTFAAIVRCRGKRVYSKLNIHAPGAARFGALTNRIVDLTFLAALCEPGDR